ncbi:sterol desaturase family protein [Microbulbifer litoralis]|uniref:sterol desaturase family protein n=1 Tax=Microbulbifer litoralis TaxID=2933965 RepID=UPI002027B522|nr:sterol desaturase family protein [Microbulbifer sp. GX H0434]
MTYLRNILSSIWYGNLHLRDSDRQKLILVVISVVGFLAWLIPQPIISDFRSIVEADSARVFYMAKDLVLDSVSAPLASILVAGLVVRAVFVILVGCADMIFYRRVSGRPFDYQGMFNISMVNLFLVFGGLFAFFNSDIQSLLEHYDELVQSVPTLIELNGVVALVVSMLIGDFCFYWSHRLCHNVRFFWNLGHIYHHRNRNLTQLTCAIEPTSVLLQAAGGLTLVVLPLLSKLFTSNIQNAGWALVVVMIVDVLVDPSHSPVLYRIESRSRILKSLRWFFVTVGVHYTHHSREEKHNIHSGCNFGARLTIWDRLFGTYREPDDELPEAGLFSDTADYCMNPVRYILQPFVRMSDELRRNNIIHWPMILFGPTTYQPPNQSPVKP